MAHDVASSSQAEHTRYQQKINNPVKSKHTIIFITVSYSLDMGQHFNAMLNARIYQCSFLDIELVTPLQLYSSPLHCYKILNFAESTNSETREGPFSALLLLLAHMRTFLVLGGKEKNRALQTLMTLTLTAERYLCKAL